MFETMSRKKNKEEMKSEGQIEHEKVNSYASEKKSKTLDSDRTQPNIITCPTPETNINLISPNIKITSKR